MACGIDGANAKRNQELGLRVLEHTLAAAACLPKRAFKNAAEFAAYLKNEETLIFDGAEQRTQRPNHDVAQKENYSGKKVPYRQSHDFEQPTAEDLVCQSLLGWKTHDYRMFSEEFPPGQDWFKSFRVRIDLGFLGIERDYICKELLLPNKKRKKQELSSEQKYENKLLASERIYVEHALGGMKRYRILSERLRIHGVGLSNVILGVCAGLWNFYLIH